MKNANRIQVIFLFAVSVAFSSCSTNMRLTGTKHDMDEKRKRDIVLGDYPRGYYHYSIEFSQDGNAVCFYNKGGLKYIIPSKWFIFDTKGNLLESHINDNQSIGDAGLMFPFLAASQSWRTNLMDVSAWAYCPIIDRSVLGINRLNPLTIIGTDSLIKMVAKEAINQPCWDTNIVSAVCRSISFIPGERGSDVLVCFSGIGGVVLDAKTGVEKAAFTYGSIQANVDNNQFRFWGNEFSVDMGGRYLAVGESSGRRVRIIRLQKPFDVVFEACKGLSPSGWGGWWQVRRVEFVASGKYLVVESSYCGRLTWRQRLIVDIYETEHWKKVWHSEDRNISCTTISPDGKTKAFVRKNVLKIEPFTPRSL